MNTREFVAKGISKVFEDLAVALADEYAKEYGEDMPTGSLAFEVMKAEMYMLKQWAKFADRESAQQGRAVDAPQAGAQSDNTRAAHH